MYSIILYLCDQLNSQLTNLRREHGAKIGGQFVEDIQALQDSLRAFKRYF